MKKQRYILIISDAEFVRVFDNIKKEFVTYPISRRIAERILKQYE